jgi:uncharacterized protein
VTEVFADTFFYLALLSRESTARAHAQAVAAALRARTVTTGFVLLEVANALSARAHRGAYVELARRLAASRSTTVLPASADLFGRGQSLYASRADKDWSLTDCTSFVGGRKRGGTETGSGADSRRRGLAASVISYVTRPNRSASARPRFSAQDAAVPRLSQSHDDRCIRPTLR